jgi:peroxiredoxin Q/BCP
MREIEGLGATVCGVSLDDSDSHADFSRKYKLPFLLLADRKGKVAALYGSLRDLGIIKLAKRNTFLIDAHGKVAKVYVGVNAARNTQDVTGDLRTLVKTGSMA